MRVQPKYVIERNCLHETKHYGTWIYTNEFVCVHVYVCVHVDTNGKPQVSFLRRCLPCLRDRMTP